ncbi:hypothetical protein TNCV_4444321 [Trichonephila clavipes]|nr:hypothetical protein TNCV_4444321 [Trichonephila clavipes]
MATPGSSFTPTPLGHEDNLESGTRQARSLFFADIRRGLFTSEQDHGPNLALLNVGDWEQQQKNLIT